MKSHKMLQMTLAFAVVVSCLFSITAPVRAQDYYVDASAGNDQNPGTQALPLKTISSGVSKAQAGSTVWIAAGTYREYINLPRSGSDANHTVTLSALPGAAVSIKGSDLATGWTAYSGQIWQKAGWQANSQQVFVDGLPLQQIGGNSPLQTAIYQGAPVLAAVGKGISDMIPGSFWYDSNAKNLYVRLSDGSNPNSHTVEASDRNWVISPLGVQNYIGLRNLNFSHSNQTAAGLTNGLVNVWGNFWTITGCTFNYGDFAGIHAIGQGHLITGCKFMNNGCLGIDLNGSDPAHNWLPVPGRSLQNLVFSNNQTCFNNYRQFNTSWGAGGLKGVPTCNGVTILNLLSQSNNGPGIWFDSGNNNITIKNCSIISNNGAGIFYEISDGATIAFNLVAGNGAGGIYVAASGGSTIYNNTVYNNWSGIVIHGEPRSEHPTLSGNRALNNILADNTYADFVQYVGQGASGNTSDYNLFQRTNGTVRISYSSDSSYGINYTNLKSLSAATSQETHSLNAAPLFTDEANGDFSLQDDSPASDSGFWIAGTSPPSQDGKTYMGAFPHNIAPPTNLKIY